MTVITKRLAHWMLCVTMVLGTGTGVARVAAQAPAGQPVATADELKSKALEALRAGKFALTQDYLKQAAALSTDPTVQQMATWAKQFEDQRQVFVGERQKEYEKAAADARMLHSKNLDTYAIEMGAKAYLLYDNKDAFRAQPWVAELLTHAKKLAEDYEKNQQWLKSLRIYSQLSTIEPEVPEWKDRLKTSTRRVRLLAMYTPDEMKRIQEADAKEREEVETMLHPTTKPTTKPSDEEAENHNRTKWEDTLRGVRMDMLKTSLLNSHENYYRSVNFKKMLLGGLNGLRVVATTPALQKAFPGLSDAQKRSEFLGLLDASIARLQKPGARDEADVVGSVLSDLEKTNTNSVELPEEVLVYEFADGAFSSLDPFSSIIWPSDWEEFQKTTKGEFSGVGIQIQTDEAGNLKVVSPLEDSPAYKQGIKPDSIITHINGKSARWVTTNQAVKLITGPKGTKVRLTIKDPKGEVKDYELTRDIIKVASVKGWLHHPGGWDYLVDPDQKIAYVRLTNFTKTTSDDLDSAIKEMERKGVRGIIMDLRYNPGGLLNSATDIVDKFITDGVIVSTRPDRTDSPLRETRTSAHHTQDEIKTPMVVLVNQYSASASEIVSGALKDHHRAIIVGERTFGKGSVQMLYPLGERQPNPEAVLKLTTSHYYLPSGKCIHREEDSKEWGVEPDLTVEMTPDQMRAAIEARQDMEVLRDESAPGEKKPDAKKKDPLAADPQLAAALLVMRLQLAGGQAVVSR